MVAVVVIIGVLSVVALPRLGGDFAASRSLHDQALAQIAYARKAAIAQRRAICVYVAAAQSELFYPDNAGTCPGGGTGVQGPDGAIPYRIGAPAGTTLGAATFQFDAQGSYLTAAGAATTVPLVIAITGADNFQITVEHVTGYVR